MSPSGTSFHEREFLNMKLINRGVIAVTFAFVTTHALAHNHITVDTPSGTPGEHVIIRAGYNPSEAGYSIIDGRLSLNGEPVTYDISESIAEPGHENWIGGDELVLTSDFYFGTGRLDNGDFLFEIVSVTPVGSGTPNAVFAWGEAHKKDAGIHFHALSDATMRHDRSFHVGAGEHGHGQVYAISDPGVYDITLVAWDANGVYADSAPVTFRIATPPPMCAGDANNDQLVNGADLSVLLSQFGQSVTTGTGADFNNDGIVNGSDLSVLLARFGLSC